MVIALATAGFAMAPQALAESAMRADEGFVRGVPLGPRDGDSRGRRTAPAEVLHSIRGLHGNIAMTIDDSASRAKRGAFDARTQIPCAQERGQDLMECAAAVARGTSGDATVVVTFPNGFRRTLYFERGAFVRANPTMSGNGTDIIGGMEGDAHRIRVDDQRYELPNAFVLGP